MANTLLNNSNGGKLSLLSRGASAILGLLLMGGVAEVSAQTTFNYTGASQNYTVPAGVTAIQVDVRGASGGAGNPATHQGGFGARVQDTLTVTPGQVLQVYVGSAGAAGSTGTFAAGGYNGGGNGGYYPGNWGGGGGGGASDIRQSPYGLANRMVVAGGGGGGGYNYSTTNYDRGGHGGNAIGETGYGGGSIGGQGAGTGGNQSAGGIGGTFSGYCTASNGALGTGGAAGTCNSAGGGGGGGYYGGGGGTWSGGGGGSSYPTTTLMTQGYQSGNGQVIITPLSVGCATPSSVSANPATSCAGSSVNLNATSTGNNINWYTVSTGGTSLGSSASGANFAVTPSVTTTYYAEAVGAGSSGSQTFSYTGSVQTFVVPSGVTSITVDMYGAEGFGALGYGGRLQATHPVTPGEVLQVYVGGAGGPTTGGFNGGGVPGSNSTYGGGGGASDIRRGGTTLNDRVLVAGGGGGTGSNCGTNTAEGGHGGGLIGESGCLYSCSSCQYTGAGGTQSAGGIAGPTSHGSCGGNTNGSFGQGGSNTGQYGTGGGGGWYGGGSGCFEGAGGGSSYSGPLASGVVHTVGARTGNGQIIITYSASSCTPSTRVPVTVTVDQFTAANAGTDQTVCAGTAIMAANTPTTGSGMWSLISGSGTITSATSPTTSITGIGAGTNVFRWMVDNGVCTDSQDDIVLIGDSIAPVIANCPANITQALDSTQCTVSISWTPPTATDNCSANPATSTHNPGDSFSPGTTTVTYTVTDQYMNISTCSFDVILSQTALSLSSSALVYAGGANTSCAGSSDGEATASPAGGCLPYNYVWSNGGTTSTITGLSGGTYDVTVTDGSGNTQIGSVTIVEAQPLTGPFISFTSGGPVNCDGDQVAVEAPAGFSSYTWSTGSTTSSTQVTSNGMVYVTLVDSNGCSGMDSVSVAFNAGPSPVITQSGSVLTASSAASYQWFRDGVLLTGETNQTINATIPGTYTVVVTDANGCTGESNAIVIVTGITDPNFGQSLSIFPNPFNGTFTFDLTLPESMQVTATVYGLNGAVVWSGQSTGNVMHFRETVNAQSVAAGVYFLRIQAGDHLIVRKVVKQ